MSSIFLDNDGTLAAFDEKVREILGMSFAQHSAAFKVKNTWRAIRHYRCPETDRGFFESLELLPDAMDLINAVRHRNPTILTGCPFGDWAPIQKHAWRERVLPDLPMITCMSKDKFLHMTAPGDILIDDQEKHREAWENAGGIWITHVSAAESIRQLKEIKPEWFDFSV